jgi:formylglycine-generating enzyme required for sulfatase activity
MQNKREALGINLPFVFIKKDSLFLSGPKQWYVHDYKKSDSIELTNQFATTNVWMGQAEISNKNYKSFLNSLLKDSLIELYQKCNVDETAWLKKDSLNPFYDSLSRYYFTSDYYNSYPVVCITYESMKEYVNWLNRNEPSQNIIYAFPHEDEWLTAFNTKNSNDSSFAWEGNNYLNSQNRMLANFAFLDPNQLRYDHIDDHMWFHDFKNEGYLSIINGPKPIYSYNPNLMGTYNMSGNVAEIINTPPKQIGDTIIYWTKGGSWSSPLYYLRKHTWERYVLPSPYVGFRVVKYEIINKSK